MTLNFDEIAFSWPFGMAKRTNYNIRSTAANIIFKEIVRNGSEFGERCFKLVYFRLSPHKHHFLDPCMIIRPINLK